MTSRPDDLGPWWLERQRDPASPDFEAGRGPVNVTHRDWVELGTLASGRRGVVDPRGLVSPGDGSWSLDWWVGAEDRWHLPSREVAVRQRREDDAPVVETAMRVPGGDVVHRVYAAQADGGPALVVEITNDTPVPVAVALVVVPYGPTGVGSVRTVACEREQVLVDDRPAMVLPRRPGRLAGGCLADVLATVRDGTAPAPSDAHHADCADGAGSLALVYPVPHRTTLRVLLPLGEARPRHAAAPARVAAVDEIERGWRAHLQRGATVALPDEHVGAALGAALRDLLVFHAGEEIVTWPGQTEPWPSAAVVLEALEEFGFAREVEQVLRGLPDEQRLDGGVVSTGGELAANGAALRVIGRHWQLDRDAPLLEHLVGPVAKAAHWIDKRRTARRRPLLVHGRYVDAIWSVSGLRAVTPALRATGQPEVADDLSGFAARLEADLDLALAADEARSGRPAPPIAPGAPLRGDAAVNLAASRLDVWGPADRRLVALVEHVRATALAADLVVDRDGWGLDPRATLELALAELDLGDDRCADRLYAVLARATPCRTWPEVLHPRTGGGSRGHGHDPVTAALLALLVRGLLVRERATALWLAPIVPEPWLGQPWEVRDLPTAHGRLGYAVRWHGERAALLWELQPHEADATVELAAPGLDPTWSTTRPSGEALLAPVGRRGPRAGGDDEPAVPRPGAAEHAAGGGAEASSSFT